MARLWAETYHAQNQSLLIAPPFPHQISHSKVPPNIVGQDLREVQHPDQMLPSSCPQIRSQDSKKPCDNSRASRVAKSLKSKAFCRNQSLLNILAIRACSNPTLSADSRREHSSSPHICAIRRANSPMVYVFAWAESGTIRRRALGRLKLNSLALRFGPWPRYRS